MARRLSLLPPLRVRIFAFSIVLRLLIFLALSIFFFFWPSIFFIYPRGQSHQSVGTLLSQGGPLLGKATYPPTLRYLLSNRNRCNPTISRRRGTRVALLILSAGAIFCRISTWADRNIYYFVTGWAALWFFLCFVFLFRPAGSFLLHFIFCL